MMHIAALVCCLEFPRMSVLSVQARSFFTTSAAELSLRPCMCMRCYQTLFWPGRLMDVAPKDLSQIATAMATIGMTEVDPVFYREHTCIFL